VTAGKVRLPHDHSSVVQGRDRAAEVEGARARLLARLEACGKWQHSWRTRGATLRAPWWKRETTRRGH